MSEIFEITLSVALSDEPRARAKETVAAFELLDTLRGMIVPPCKLTQRLYKLREKKAAAEPVTLPVGRARHTEAA